MLCNNVQDANKISVRKKSKVWIYMYNRNFFMKHSVVCVCKISSVHKRSGKIHTKLLLVDSSRGEVGIGNKNQKKLLFYL